MFKVQTLNKIAPAGLELMPREKYEVASEIANPDAIILRSFNMHEMELPLSLKAVARAGARHSHTRGGASLHSHRG